MLADECLLEKIIHQCQIQAALEISLSEFARQLELTPCELVHRVQAATGVSLSALLQAVTRLSQAKSLICEISELAVQKSSRFSIYQETLMPAQQRGIGLKLRWGIHKTHFGPLVLVLSQHGLFALNFLADSCYLQVEVFQKLAKRWPGAEIQADPEHIRSLLPAIFSASATPLRIHLYGSTFQLQVWQALLHIPPGKLTSYAALARWLGKPQASRAVGQAVAKNPIHYLFPCHRVVCSDGSLGDYAGGKIRKQILLAWELASVLDHQRPPPRVVAKNS